MGTFYLDDLCRTKMVFYVLFFSPSLGMNHLGVLTKLLCYQLCYWHVIDLVS